MNAQYYEQAIRQATYSGGGEFLEIEGSLEALRTVATQIGYETDYQADCDRRGDECFFVWGTEGMAAGNES